MKLKLLKVRALRGLRDLEIPFEGKGLLLWGENGSGKSSIVDALDFLFTGQIRHLGGIRGLSLSRHGPHFDMGETAMEVEATFDPGPVVVSRTISNAPVVPSVLATVWDTAKGGNFVLRRSQLLDFIHADPAERFRTVGSLIGIEALDEIELAMMRARDRFDGDATAQGQEVRRIEGRLGNLVGVVSGTPDSVLAEINIKASSLRLSNLASLADIAQTIPGWLRSVKEADQGRLGALNVVTNQVDAVGVPDDLAARLEDYRRVYSKLASQRATLDRLSEAALLEEGQKFLESTNTTVCPLCEQPIDLPSVLTRVLERRHLLQELSNEFAIFRGACQELSSVISLLSSRIKALRGVIVQELDPEVRVRDRLSELAATLDESARSLQASAGLQEMSSTDQILAAASNLQTICSALSQQVAQTLANVDLTERDRAVLDLFQKADTLRALSNELSEQMSKLNRLNRMKQGATYIFDTFSDCKKAEVRRVYQAIESDVRNFNTELHPGEPHTGFELLLAEGRRASTELRIRSFGQEATDPRAYTSEGHLDSLGLCIFLAFAKHFLSGWEFIVLDDVIMSIDSSHRGRVANLLLREFSGWQLVVTTHDEIWFEEFFRHQRAYDAEGRFLNLRIHRWSLTEGAVIHPYRPRWERILDKLSSADKTGAANDGRQFLEWVLAEVCVSTLAEVRLRRDGRYGVEHLLSPARQRLTKLLPEKKKEIDQLFQEIEAAGTPGNLLSHNNPNALSLSVEEIRRFCESVNALHNWLVCTTCTQMPSYLQELKLLRCLNPHCTDPKEWTTR